MALTAVLLPDRNLCHQHPADLRRKISAADAMPQDGGDHTEEPSEYLFENKA